MNWNEIKLRVWDRLGEDSADPQRYTDALINEFAREASEIWSIEVGLDTGSTSVTLVDDQLEYDLQGIEFIRLLEIKDATTKQNLHPITLRELYESEGGGRNRRWRNVRSVRPTHYSLFSYDKLWLWPPMSTADRNITVTYQRLVDDDLTHSESASAAIAAAGSGYSADDVLTGTTGTGTKATYTVDTVGGSGEVTAITLLTAGLYTVDPDTSEATTVDPAGGTGCQLTHTILESDVPLPNTEFHSRIVDYVVGRLLMLSSNDEARIEKAVQFVSRFFDAVKQAGAARASTKTWQIHADGGSM